MTIDEAKEVIKKLKSAREKGQTEIVAEVIENIDVFKPILNRPRFYIGYEAGRKPEPPS